MADNIVTTITKTDVDTGEVLFKKEYPAGTYISTENVARDKFLKTHTKHEFDSFIIQNNQVEYFYSIIPSMNLTTKLYFFFCANIEPVTNKIMHPNGKKITNKFLANYFKVSDRAIKYAKEELAKNDAIKKYKGWYYLNPYATIKYSKCGHYYSNLTLDLFKHI